MAIVDARGRHGDLRPDVVGVGRLGYKCSF